MTMTPDDILRMAREAGARVECWMTNPPKPALINLTPEQLERFAALVAAGEREVCAVMLKARGKALCNSAGSDREQFAAGCEAENCAELISARSQP